LSLLSYRDRNRRFVVGGVVRSRTWQHVLRGLLAAPGIGRII